MASISLTDPVAGTTVTAGLHASNNAALRAAINGTLDNTNLAAGAAIKGSQLATGITGPPGTELVYTEVTANATSTGTTPANAQAVITGASFTYDGTSAVIIEFFALEAWSTAGNDTILAELYEDATDKGLIVRAFSPSAVQGSNVYAKRKYTPAAGAKVHSVRFWNNTAARTITVGAGAGGASVDFPMFLRITKA